MVRSLHADSAGPTGTAGGTRCSIAAWMKALKYHMNRKRYLNRNGDGEMDAITRLQYTHISLALIDFTQATFALLFVMVRSCFMF